MKHWIYLIVGTLTACLFAASNHAHAQVLRSYDFETNPNATLGLWTAGDPSLAWFLGNAQGSAAQGLIVPDHTRFLFSSDRHPDCEDANCNKSDEMVALNPQAGALQFDLDDVVFECDVFFTGENGETAEIVAFANGDTALTVLQEIEPSDEWTTVTASLEEWRNKVFIVGIRYSDGGNAANGIAIDNFRIYVKTPGVNLQLTSLSNVFEFMQPGPKEIIGNVENRASEIITSFDFNYSVNEGDTVTFKVEDIELQPTALLQITHDVPAELIEPGKYEIVAWVSNVNGLEEDVDISDDTVTVRSQVVSDLVPRKLLAERFTNTACPACPVSTVAAERVMLASPDSMLVVNYHVTEFPTSTDPMANALSDAWDKEYESMLGGVGNRLNRLFYHLDRTYFASYLQLPGYFRVLSDLTAAPVELMIDREESTFNPGRRELRLKVGLRSVAEIDINDSQLAVTAIIVEDNVRGADAQGYSQANAADADAAYPELRGRGNPIVGYEHHNTFRTFSTDQWGDRVIDHLETLMPEDTIWTELVIRTPSGLDMSNVRVVLAVGREDAEDPFRRNVFNSTSIYPKDLDPTSADARKSGALNRMNLYPNPNSGQFTLSFGADSQYDLNVTGVDGREVAHRVGLEGDEFQIDLSDLKAGAYVVQVRDTRTGQTFNQKLILN